MLKNIQKIFLKYFKKLFKNIKKIFQIFQKNFKNISKNVKNISKISKKNSKKFQKILRKNVTNIFLAVPDPALLGFDYFPIYYILIIAIPDS